ncbi:hypothetical protein AB0J83_16940 [Actinoplanes sp. NPDC049596]|uniref:hypothetical protein n=1 Tax=unclassified Actinoplanes TaxID=2626549 RepID=UPI003429FB07
MRRLILRLSAALTIAALLAGAVAWATWPALAGDLPTDERMHALAGLVVEGSEKGTDITRVEHVAGSSYGDDVQDGSNWLLGVDEYRAGYARTSFGAAKTDLAAAGERLEADGWRVGRDDGTLVAANDAWRLRFEPTDGEGSDAVLTVERGAPMAALALTSLAWIAGLALGWRLARRFDNPVGIAAMVVLCLNTLDTTLTVVDNAVLIGGTRPFGLPWAFSAYYGARPFVLLGLALTALTLLVGGRVAVAPKVQRELSA